MAEGISVETKSRVAHVKISRPEKKNALTTGMYADLADAFEWIADDDGVRVVAIEGGTDFTSGNDLTDFIQASMKAASFEELPVMRFLGRLRDCKKPVVAAVRGNAIGIGTTMLLHCDVVVAARDARFRLPFVSLGLVPEAGATLLLPQMVGRMRANWLLLSGEFFYAEEAQAMGLVTKLVDDEIVDSTATEIAGQLALLPSTSVVETKRLLRSPTADQVVAQMEEEARVFAAHLASEEFREAAMKLLSR